MISIIVPFYNAENTLERLLDSILKQSFSDFELIVVDDASTDSSLRIAQSYPCKTIHLDRNHGPAYCRNIGAKHAKGDILVFIDSDCQAHPDWLKHINDYSYDNRIVALMGRLILMPSTYIGESISALGFPAGGTIGFEKIWKVDADGFTSSLSSCNCAVKKHVFNYIGGFDESFPYAGGEDSFFAYTLIENGYRIKYIPHMIVYHEARSSLRSFMKWHFKRGISSYIFSMKIRNKSDYFRLRLWSTKNIFKAFKHDHKFPMILCLLSISFMVQFIGFTVARYNRDL